MVKRMLSTEEVAKMLEVNKSTVKRWSDSGKIRCIRTIGHHRKFNYNDVLDFAVKNNYRPEMMSGQKEQQKETEVIKELVRTNDLNSFRSVVSSSSLHGNRSEIAELFSLLYQQHLSHIEIIHRIILPVLQKFERTVEQHRLDPERCLVARNTLSSAFTAFSGRVERLKRKNALIIIYTFEHSIEAELKILEAKLEIDGYLVVNLGCVRSWMVVEQWVGRSGTDMMLCLLKQSHNRNSSSADFIALDKIAESRGMLFLCGTIDLFVGIDPEHVYREFRVSLETHNT